MAPIALHFEKPSLISLAFHHVFENEAEVESGLVLPQEAVTVAGCPGVSSTIAEAGYRFVSVNAIVNDLGSSGVAFLTFDDGNASLHPDPRSSPRVRDSCRGELVDLATVDAVAIGNHTRIMSRSRSLPARRRAKRSCAKGDDRAWPAAVAYPEGAYNVEVRGIARNSAYVWAHDTAETSAFR